MRYFLILFCLTGCLGNSNPCGFTQDTQNGGFFCEAPLDADPNNVFCVKSANVVDFYDCNCQPTRTHVVSFGQPVCSEPSRGECYAVSPGVVLDKDCQYSTNGNNFYSNCQYNIKWYAPFACYDMKEF